ncbi:unnamed protein product [Timema podura]|uniref:non-specific serine/threonine protein kinase n=1 Tax=Timema podura TaxID=61482 RepID=A0ABN7NED7_TIMPD|nr:unnamed protein product [Timema podura]
MASDGVLLLRVLIIEGLAGRVDLAGVAALFYTRVYMQCRGNSKRHTLAMASAEEVQEAQRKMVQLQQQQPMRTRRTGLLTVMERPPVISPEMVQEVEARMNRQHTPHKLNTQTVSLNPARSKIFLRTKKPSGLATVQESNRLGKNPPSSPDQDSNLDLPVLSGLAQHDWRVSQLRHRGIRESFKEVNSLHLPQERYSPVRRASEGSASNLGAQYKTSPQHNFQTQIILDKESKVKALQQEYQQLQVLCDQSVYDKAITIARNSGGMADAQTQAELQLLHSLHIQQILGQGGGAPASTLSPLATPHMSPTPSPPINHSPASIPGSPIHHAHPSENVEGNITLAHHLQHLHLQQQQQISSELAQGQNFFPRYIQNGCMSSLPPSPTCTSPVGIVGSGSCVGAISITSITQGLSGLSTNTGSITHGIPTVNVPLDLRIQQPSISTSPHHSVHLHHRSPVITPLQLSPTNSTTLGMIQEENNIGFHQQLLGSDVIENILSGKIRSQLSEKRINATGSKHLQTGINQSFPSHHPQISVTDEMGGEVTLVESLSSSDSSDSLTCDVNETREIDGMIVEDFTLHQNSASFHNTLPSKVEFIPTSVIMEQTHEQMSQFQPTLNFVVQNTDLGVSIDREGSSYSSPSMIPVPTFPINSFCGTTTILPSFVISGPCDPSRPSIVRGIGKKKNVEDYDSEMKFDGISKSINEHVCMERECCSDSIECCQQNVDGNDVEISKQSFEQCMPPLTSLSKMEECRSTYSEHKNYLLRHMFPPPTTFTSYSHNPDFYASDDSSNSTENFQNFHNNYTTNAMDITYENGKNTIFKDTLTNSPSITSMSAGNVFASELLQKTSSGSFKVTLSDFCSRLTATDILGLVKRLIDARAPPKGFTFSSHMSDSGDYSEGGLALEYPGGVQIELMVCTDLGCELKGLKMRRISGDQHQYSQLCQELISCMTV